MKLSDTTKERLTVALISSLSGLLSVAFSGVIKEAVLPFVQDVVPLLDNKSLLWLCFLSLLVNLLLGAFAGGLLWVFHFNNPKRNYEFLPQRGFYRHKKTGQFFCPNCLLKNIESPLGKAGTQIATTLTPVWNCRNLDCKSIFPRKLPEEE